MKIISINVGMPQMLKFNGAEVLTGFIKTPVPGPVMVRKLNLDGDGQAELKVHGGFDKAVYAFSSDAYRLFEKDYPKEKLGWGAFGENLTLDHFDDSKVYVGDVFTNGSCVLEVSEPRLPCAKLGMRFGDMGIIKKFLEARRPGIYFRVLSEGPLMLNSTFKVTQDKAQIALTELVEIYKTKKIKPERAQELLAHPALGQAWKKKIQNLIT